MALEEGRRERAAGRQRTSEVNERIEGFSNEKQETRNEISLLLMSDLATADQNDDLLVRLRRKFYPQPHDDRVGNKNNSQLPIQNNNETEIKNKMRRATRQRIRR